MNITLLYQIENQSLFQDLILFFLTQKYYIRSFSKKSTFAAFVLGKSLMKRLFRINNMKYDSISLVTICILFYDISKVNQSCYVIVFHWNLPRLVIKRSRVQNSTLRNSVFQKGFLH